MLIIELPKSSSFHLEDEKEDNSKEENFQNNIFSGKIFLKLIIISITIISYIFIYLKTTFLSKNKKLILGILILIFDLIILSL